MSSHYLAVLIPEKSGGWSVLFPDLPGCAMHGATVHEAIANASNAASAWLTVTLQLGDEIPAPKSYEDLRADEAWARDRGVDRSTALVSLVPVTFPATDSKGGFEIMCTRYVAYGASMRQTPGTSSAVRPVLPNDGPTIRLS